VLALVGLMLVAVLFTPAVNGARRWLGVGGLGIQPSELAKIVAVLFTALMLERRMHRINEVSYSLTPILIVSGALVGLILLERDYGTSMSLLLIVGVMIFAAGLSYRYVVGTALVLLPVL
jgi:cell division protein FtsW